MTKEEAVDFISSSFEASGQEIVEEKEVIKKESDSGETSEKVVPTLEVEDKGAVVRTIAGRYSENAMLQHVVKDVEAEASLPVSLQLFENGTGTVNVDGFDGEAQYAGNKVTFTVKMKEDGAVVRGEFKGKASRNDEGTEISGELKFSLMGINFATYTWAAQK